MPLQRGITNGYERSRDVCFAAGSLCKSETFCLRMCECLRMGVVLFLSCAKSARERNVPVGGRNVLFAALFINATSTGEVLHLLLITVDLYIRTRRPHTARVCGARHSSRLRRARCRT